MLDGEAAGNGGDCWLVAAAGGAASGCLRRSDATTPVFRSRVDLVVLSFTVTDNKGKYVNGLKPADFRIMEDGIKEKLATFSEGNRPAMQILADGSHEAAGARRAAAIREHAVNIRPRRRAILWAPTCSFSSTPATSCITGSSTPKTPSPISCAASTRPIRWRSIRSAAICRARRSLTHDRNDAIFGLRKAVAGDDTALYNGLLLTLRDAAKVPGRKVVIVFSNGPDNASMVAPDDVRAVAEDEGIPIYVISTNDVNKDPISSNVFKRIATRTGGKAYWAKTWQKQVEAFEAIREDLGNSYTVTYYPAPESERRIPQDRYSDRQRHGEALPRQVASRVSASTELEAKGGWRRGYTGGASGAPDFLIRFARTKSVPIASRRSVQAE